MVIKVDSIVKGAIEHDKATEKRIFFREIDIRDVVEKYQKWKETDHRRKLLAVKFSDGSVWYPKDDDLRIIEQGKDHVFKHNTKFANIDPPAVAS